jgi:hypothetical protein
VSKGPAVLLLTTGYALTNLVVGFLFDYAYAYCGIGTPGMLGPQFAFFVLTVGTIGFTLFTSIIFAIVAAVATPPFIGRLSSQRLFLVGCRWAVLVLIPVIALLIAVR